MSDSHRRFRMTLAVLAALAFGLWLLLRTSPGPESLQAEGQASPQVEQPSDAGPVPSAPLRRAPKKPGEAVTKCEPGADQRCFRGDVWSVDGCDALEGKIDECGARACRDAACEPAPATPCLEPLEGRCDGELVRLCYAGRPHFIDCKAQGLSCVMGDEGAECVPEIPRAERCTGRSRCEGSRLIRCEAGRKVETDCESERAECLTLPNARAPQCVQLKAKESKTARDCGPCGCAADPQAEEQRCDGHDDDGDGLVDEGLDCGAMPIVAFVITDAAGNSSHGPEDVATEIERINAIMQDDSSEGAGLSFVLDELIWLKEPSLLEIEDGEIGALADDPRVHPTRKEAYLPLIFTDSIVGGGGTPKAGVSTLPNGFCGGMQERPGPKLGIVAVAKGRSETTVVHEIGHFLGLCHTHELRHGAAISAVVSGDQIEGCNPSCRAEGDGICDTPADPGPEQCIYDASCATGCRAGERPDATNLMSYYTSCRTRFSPEQLAVMEHSLALRRGWYPCSVDACRCELGQDSCPEGMSCRPHTRDGQATYLCSLDGPHGPGADCRRATDCGNESICLSDTKNGLQRCARVCAESTPDCTCVSADDTLKVCREDMTP